MHVQCATADVFDWSFDGSNAGHVPGAGKRAEDDSGAAVAAAQEVSHQRLCAEGIGERLPVSETAAAAAVSAYVHRAAERTGLESVAVTAVEVDPAGGVTVRLSARVAVPLPSPVTAPWSDGIPVSAGSRAVSYVQ